MNTENQQRSYIECSKVGKIDSSQMEDLLELLKSLCIELKLIKWCENIWCPLGNSSNNHRSLDFTKIQKYSNNEARILQYTYPAEYKNIVNITCQNPIIESNRNNNFTPNEFNKKISSVAVNQIIECYASKSIMDVFQHLNIASNTSNPPTVYNTVFVNCYMGTINPLQEDEVNVFVQTEYKDLNFSYKNNDYISVILKSKCLDENNISLNKQAIVNVCRKLDKIVCF